MSHEEFVTFSFFTFVDIGAVPSVALESNSALTVKTAGGVGAVGLLVTVVTFIGALVTVKETAIIALQVAFVACAVVTASAVNAACIFIAVICLDCTFVYVITGTDAFDGSVGRSGLTNASVGW